MHFQKLWWLAEMRRQKNMTIPQKLAEMVELCKYGAEIKKEYNIKEKQFVYKEGVGKIKEDADSERTV
jgi:hypothetical protein